MKSVESTFADKCQCVVLFKEELTGGVERNAMLCQAVDDGLRLFHNQAHCFVPSSFHKDAIFANERVRKPVFVMDSFPLQKS
jgi:hypothetical protein